MATPELVLPRTLWIPTDKHKTNMEIFIRQVNAKRGLKLKDSRDLYAWSIHPDTCSDFWVDLFNYEHLKLGTSPKCAFLPKVWAY